MEGIAKSTMPRYQEMATQISREMIDNFSAQEQREMIDIIESNISENYSQRIAELQKDVENAKHLQQQFLGKKIATISLDNNSLIAGRD